MGEFNSDIDLDAEVAAGLDTEMHMEADDIDEKPVLEEPFSALDLDGDNDSGPDPEDYAPGLPELQGADDQRHE